MKIIFMLYQAFISFNGYNILITQNDTPYFYNKIKKLSHI